MRLIRTSVVTLVTVVLLAVAVPAAQARSIEKPAAVHSQGGAWLDYSLENALENAVTWLLRLAGNEPPARMATKTITITPGPDAPIGPILKPNTGGCIDPLGAGRCN